MTESIQNKPIVQLRQLTRIYQQGQIRVTAVDQVSLDIMTGAFTVLCGPSGSGKTSLLNLIGGLDLPTTGTVSVDGVDLASLSRSQLSSLRKNRIGFIFQAYNLIKVMTAYENAAFVLTLQGINQTECRQRVLATLAEVGLAGLENRRPDEMSGGQQQRVAIARAIVTRPAIVLADEPTANVDSETAIDLLELMQRLNQQQGITFLFSTHDPRVIERGRRVIRIRDGRIESDRLQN